MPRRAGKINLLVYLPASDVSYLCLDFMEAEFVRLIRFLLQANLSEETHYFLKRKSGHSQKQVIFNDTPQKPAMMKTFTHKPYCFIVHDIYECLSVYKRFLGVLTCVFFASSRREWRQWCCIGRDSAACRMRSGKPIYTKVYFHFAWFGFFADY